MGFERAITNAVRPDGTKLAGSMPYDWYANMKPSDLAIGGRSGKGSDAMRMTVDRAASPLSGLAMVVGATTFTT